MGGATETRFLVSEISIFTEGPWNGFVGMPVIDQINTRPNKDMVLLQSYLYKNLLWKKAIIHQIKEFNYLMSTPMHFPFFPTAFS